MVHPSQTRVEPTAYRCSRTEGSTGAHARQRARAERRAQQAREVEASQVSLRASIEQTERLVSPSNRMLARHPPEREDDDV